MKFLLPFLFSLSLALGQTPEELDRTLKKLAPDLVASTVAIMVGQGSGSGVIVTADGLVITAAHVTSTPGEQMSVLLSDGRELPATSLGVDHTTDGALLKINSPGPFPFRPYIKEKTYEIGEFAIATGHPGGPVVGRPSPIRLGRIIEAGTKSGFNDAITTTATVISGDSGGPLYNLKGEVIGINSNIGMPWSVNKHVPLPAIVEKWDELMNNETIGAAQSMAQQTEYYFDEPYAGLREKFEAALEENSGDPFAAELLKHPRLLDPHHMQDFLDRIDTEEGEGETVEEIPKAPHFGFTLDLKASSPTIASIQSGGPAEKAGLAKGDIITSANNQAVKSTITLALKLKAKAPLTLTTANNKTATLSPDEVPARRHFPQPVAGLISMMITNGSGKQPASIQKSNLEFLTSLNVLQQALQNSVLEIKRGDKTVIHATVVSPTGRLVTKASELSKPEELLAHFKGRTYPITIIGTDKATDIALISINADGLVSVRWEEDEPSPATLVFSPLPDDMGYGVVTQPARSAPKKGFEKNVSSKEPSAYLGVSFSPETASAIISGVDLDSPADKIGFLEGDEVIRMNGKSIDTSEELGEAISKHGPGEKITIIVKRGDKEVTLKPILDVRQAKAIGTFDRTAARRDDSLSSLSGRGGKLSKRRDDFPRTLYHDEVLKPQNCGAPLINRKGEVVGLNIARALRHRSLAIPAKTVNEVAKKLRR
mgnify:CR=1 FL=1